MTITEEKTLEDSGVLSADEAEATEVVTGKNQFGTVSLTNVRGQVWISWSVDYPVKIYGGWVALYAGPPPSNPLVGQRYAAAISGQSGCYNTGQLWGPGWSGALFGAAWTSGYADIVTTPETT